MTAADGARRESPVEGAKRDSAYLRGTIAQELGEGRGTFSKVNAQLLKHHGTYQQDDRDQRTAQSGGKSSKKHMFMVRTRIPGGRLTANQLLAELQLCDELGDTTLRITSRQGLQLHGVLQGALAPVIRRIQDVQLTTLGACGDVNRNVMACPAPYRTPVYDELQRLAESLANHFAPRTAAFHEIWLMDQDGERERVDEMERGDTAEGVAGEGGDEVEPIYGRTYLPRKFKMGLALPHDNCIDIYTHDLGLLAVTEGSRTVGYNVLAGGGLGMTPSNKKTFPALGRQLAFVPSDRAVAIAEAVVRVQRDHGDRSDRKTARLKYLIHRWGIERFRDEVQAVYGEPLEAFRPIDVYGFDDHLGWRAHGDGLWFYGLNVENGRITDRDGFRLKTAIRELCRRFQPGIRLTSHQSMLFTDIPKTARDAFEDVLLEHGVPRTHEVSTVRRWSMACVAWPTCGLAITESERALPGVIDALEVELARLALSSEKFTVRMTGCPNGCARPYNCDVGLVGKARDKYTLYLGGRLLGNRLNFVYADLVEVNEIVPTLRPLLQFFKQEALPYESFGDFCFRQGKERLEQWSRTNPQAA